MYRPENRPELLKYHKDLVSLLNLEPDRVQRRAFLAEERKTSEYQAAKREAMIRNHPNNVPSDQSESTGGIIALKSAEERLVNIIFTQTFNLPDTDEITNWAEETLVTFNSLPRQMGQERKIVRNLITQTAKRLLQNPEYIDIVDVVWKTQSNHEDSGNSTGSFYELVKTESVELMKKNWGNVTSEQLADFIWIYTNSPSTQDFAKEMLGSYFKGPESRRQRIDAYYTLAYSTLHLIEDDKAFTQAIRIGIYDSDILPKDPNLIEETILLSLPYNEEIALQKLLIAKSVMAKLSFLSSEDLGEVRQKYSDFMHTDERFKKKWDETIGKIIKKIGFEKAKELNGAATRCNVFQKETLSEEEKRKIKNIWPYNLLLDETDPLNQKFQEVVSQRAALKTMISETAEKDL